MSNRFREFFITGMGSATMNRHTVKIILEGERKTAEPKKIVRSIRRKFRAEVGHMVAVRERDQVGSILSQAFDGSSITPEAAKYLFRKLDEREKPIHTTGPTLITIVDFSTGGKN